MAYKNIWEPHGIYIKLYGTLTDEDFYNSNLDIYDDARFPHCHYQLVDSLQVEEIQATTEAMEAVVGMDNVASTYTHNMKVALVTNNHKLHKIFSLYIKAPISPSWQAQIFDTLEEAKSWINITTPI